jgi:hypothetical protein
MRFYQWIWITMYLAEFAEVIFPSIVQGALAQVAPSALKEWIVGVPLIVPEAYVPAVVLQVRASVRMAVPPVRIGVTVAAPPSEWQPTPVITWSPPSKLEHWSGMSSSSPRAALAAPGDPNVI